MHQRTGGLRTENLQVCGGDCCVHYEVLHFIFTLEKVKSYLEWAVQMPAANGQELKDNLL